MQLYLFRQKFGFVAGKILMVADYWAYTGR
jgi:hypothetical protein